MELEFFLPGRPPTVTAQTAAWRVVNGKPVSYQPENLKRVRAELEVQLSGHRPPEPLTGPVRVIVKWLYPKGGHRVSEEGWAWKTTRPDADNLLKLLLDCMTQLKFWDDDNQVASVVSEKFWVKENPGIWIRAEILGGDSDGLQ